MRVGGAVRPGGVVVAVTGFAITRIFVAETIHLGSSLSYVLSGVVPLVAGLGLTVYGVVLAVGPYSKRYANTVARWCVAGTLGMLAVVALTTVEAVADARTVEAGFRSSQLVANVLLGGAVGGVLIGTRSAANERQRHEIERQVNRTRLFNRLLRHEVINAVTVIRGHAELLTEGETPGAETVETIRNAADRIGVTVDEVGGLSEDPVEGDPVDLGPMLADAVAELRAAFPDVTVDYDPPTAETSVAADRRLRRVLDELLENAAAAADGRVTVRSAPGPNAVSITVLDDGPGLPEDQRELLEAGRFPEYDDPGSGFGLQIVRLLVTRFGGSISVGPGIDGDGTAIEVTVPRNGGGGELGRAISVTVPNLNRAIVAGLLAGLAMGVFFANTSDVLPIIGALYAVQNPFVAWLTHLFHSVVFAVLFVAGISHDRVAPRVTGPLRHALAGVAWGSVLWLVAAGLVMPLWLRVMGVPTAVPNLPDLGFTSHAIWGVVLGLAYERFGRLGRP